MANTRHPRCECVCVPSWDSKRGTWPQLELKELRNKSNPPVPAHTPRAVLLREALGRGTRAGTQAVRLVRKPLTECFQGLISVSRLPCFLPFQLCSNLAIPPSSTVTSLATPSAALSSSTLVSRMAFQRRPRLPSSQLPVNMFLSWKTGLCRRN